MNLLLDRDPDRIMSALEGADGPLSLYASYRGGYAPPGALASLSIEQAAVQLTRTGLAWGAAGQPTSVSFAFRASADSLPDGVSGFSQFTPAQIQTTLIALQAWSDVANIVFNQVGAGGYSNNATILFGNYSQGEEGAAAFAYMPGNRDSGSSAGDVWVNGSLTYNAAPTLWGYGQLTLVHEIGHAIGLSHPSNYDARESNQFYPGYDEDSQQYTVMSYFRETRTDARYGASYAAAPMLDDIAAVQRLYGANMSTRTGDTIYGFNSNADRAWFSAGAGQPAPIFAVWDAGGVDTFDFSGYDFQQTIDLRQGAFSSVGLTGNVAIALGVVIENTQSGAGNDAIIGNSADNRIAAGLGNNSVDGGLGVDTVVFSGARSSYTISWNGAEGTVFRDGESTRVRNVEFLVFSDVTIAATPMGGLNVNGDATADVMNGTAFSDTLFGDNGNDTIRGFDGHDQLNGGRGNDVVDGGAGNDLIYADMGDDIIIGGDGTDTLSFTEGFDVYVDLARGIATGYFGNDVITGIENLTGSRGNDVLIGDDNDNYIVSFGGADLIRGGGGNDTLTGTYILTGGAADLIKDQSLSNGSFQTAVSLDASFDTLTNGNLTQYGANATVVATSHGGVEYYAFTVTQMTDATFDIDGATFDTTIRIFDSSGREIGANDDGGYIGDGGMNTDSLLNVRLPSAGTYYVQIGQFSETGGSNLGTVAPVAGGGYTLNILLPGHSVQPTYALGSSLYGEAGSDTLIGSDGNDLLDGGAGEDTLFGASSDDVLNGGAGSDVLGGGNGMDTAVYAGIRLQYSASSTSVSGGPEGGTDTLTSIEELRFVDGILSFDVDGAAARVMRLYDAALDRLPDQGGLEATSNALSAGALTLQQLANNFVGGAEFQARYGALSNRAFVEQLYRFCLNREGDAQGVAAWTNAINAGVSRGEVLVGFSEGQEHRNLTAPVLAAGLWTPDQEALTIARLYDATFDRLPDPSGLAAWVAALDGGVSIASIAANFASSTEFQQRYGTPSNQAFVEQLYRFCLDREGDAGGVQNWVDAINGGLSRAAVLLQFSEGAEHILLTAHSWSGGIQFEGYAPHAAAATAEELASLPVSYDALSSDAAQGDQSSTMTVLPSDPLFTPHVGTEGTEHMLFLAMTDEFVPIGPTHQDAVEEIWSESAYDIAPLPTALLVPVSDFSLLDAPVPDGLGLDVHRPDGDYWLH